MPRCRTSCQVGCRKSCQVLGCQNPLPSTRFYYTRYRICPYHAGLSEMTLDGNVVRFCQQCGRFHPLSDFEGNKKSCIHKLLAHNAQRKKARGIKHCPTPQAEPKTPTHHKVPVEFTVLGLCTPATCEAVMREPPPPPILLDDIDMVPFSLEEIDTLMDDFNSPVASQMVLSILTEEEERQQQQFHRIFRRFSHYCS